MLDVPSGAEVPGEPGGRTGKGLAGRLSHKLRDRMRQPTAASESSRRKLEGKTVTPTRLPVREPRVRIVDARGDRNREVEQAAEGLSYSEVLPVRDRQVDEPVPVELRGAQNHDRIRQPLSSRERSIAGACNASCKQRVGGCRDQDVCFADALCLGGMPERVPGRSVAAPDVVERERRAKDADVAAGVEEE